MREFQGIGRRFARRNIRLTPSLELLQKARRFSPDASRKYPVEMLDREPVKQSSE